MSFDFEQQSISEGLLKEQSIVQNDKNNNRLLRQYNGYIFLGARFSKGTNTSEVEEFVKENINKSVSNIEGLLTAMNKNLKRRVNWTDMGGGFGLAQRQALIDDKLRKSVNTVNVDIFRREMNELKPEDVDYLKDRFPSILDPEKDPIFIQADVETVKLKEPADLLTSVEVVQYLDNPLRTLVNWYNQLSPEGLMVVSAEHTWSDWIRYEDTVVLGGDNPLKLFFDQLEKNGIPFSFSQECYERRRSVQRRNNGRFCNLVIKKMPNTEINLLAEVTDIWTNPHSYKVVFYEKDTDVISVSHKY